MRIGIAKPIRA